MNRQVGIYISGYYKISEDIESNFYTVISREVMGLAGIGSIQYQSRMVQ